MPVKNKRSSCPLGCALDVWGDKWSLLIVRDLILFGKNTYGDFLKSDERIATNILASRLQSLEENGIITKSVHPDSKAKMLYSITQKGIELLPIIIDAMLWAEKYDNPVTDEIKSILAEIALDKEVFILSKFSEYRKQR